MIPKLTKQQISTLQKGLCEQGYACSKVGFITGSTVRAFELYHKARNLPVPDLETITEVPEFTAIPPTPPAD